MKKKLFGVLILTTLFIAGCDVPDGLSGLNDPVPEKPVNESLVSKGNVEKESVPEETMDLEIANLKITNGIISYSVKNNSISQVYYNPLFILEEFSLNTDEWENMNLTASMRENMLYGKKLADTKLPITPNGEEPEEQDISKYLRSMGAGTYHTKKFFMNVEKKLMYQLTIQFVKTGSGEVESLYAFLKQEPLSGDPLKNLIPEPVRVTSDETDESEDTEGTEE